MAKNGINKPPCEHPDKRPGRPCPRCGSWTMRTLLSGRFASAQRTGGSFKAVRRER